MAISLFVQPIRLQAICSVPMSSSVIQLSMIFLPGVITKGGRGSLPSVIIVSIIVTDLRFSGLNIQSSYTSIGIITCYLVGHLIRAPNSSIFNIFLPFIILYSVRVSRYFLNQSRMSSSMWESSLAWAIGFVLIVWRVVLLRSHKVNHLLVRGSCGGTCAYKNQYIITPRTR